MRWFRGQGGRTWLHVRLRWWTGPFGAVAALATSAAGEGVPLHVLDWGCGHGLLGLHLAEVERATGRDVAVEGTDLDPAKVASARRAVAAAGLGPQISVRTVGPDDRPVGPVDVVVVNDVLYLMAPERQERLVRAAAAAIGPGGLVICKEMGETPRWKARVVAAQERFTVGRLSVSATADVLGPFPPPPTVAGWLADEGLVTSTIPLDRGYHSPHLAVVGRRDGRLHA